MNRKLWLGGLMAVLVLFSLTIVACGDDDDESGDSITTVEDTTQAIKSNPANGDVKIVIGSKNFTEQKILGEIFAQGLAAAGYDISTELNLGDEQTALKAIRRASGPATCPGGRRSSRRRGRRRGRRSARPRSSW